MSLLNGTAVAPRYDVPPSPTKSGVQTKEGGGDMRRSWKWGLPAVALSAGIAVGLAAGPLDAQQKNVLVSKKVSAAPPMEPAMSEAWKDAQPLAVKVIGGKNLPGGSTEVTLRSVYAGDTVYFLM